VALAFAVVTETFIETPAEPAGTRLQLAAAILLGIAATFTAISAYQAALLDGESLQGYTESTRTLSDANAFYAQANQTSASDQQLFVDYASAGHAGNEELAEYLTTLMRPNLVKSISWWMSEDDAYTPMDALPGNPYAIADFDKALSLEEEADELFADAAAADDKGDKFELATVLFALTLFFGGIATLFRRRAVSVGLLGVSGIAAVLGVGQFLVALNA